MQRSKGFQALLEELYFPFLNQMFSRLIDNIFEIPDLPLKLLLSSQVLCPWWAGAAGFPCALSCIWRCHHRCFCCICVIQAHPMCHPLPACCQLLPPGLTAKSPESRLENVGFLTSSKLLYYMTLSQQFLFHLPYLPCWPWSCSFPYVEKCSGIEFILF